MAGAVKRRKRRSSLYTPFRVATRRVWAGREEIILQEWGDNVMEGLKLLQSRGAAPGTFHVKHTGGLEEGR